MGKLEILNIDINKNWLSPKEVYERYGVSVSTLAKWRMDNKHLRYSKVGKYIKYNVSDIEAWLKENSVEVAS